MPQFTSTPVSRLPEVGFCIYCGSKFYDIKRPDRTLSTEHIIPEGLGGTILLPKACCSKCEGITSAFEGSTQRRVFGPLRIFLGLPTKRPKDRPTSLPVKVVFESPELSTEYQIPIKDCPLICAVVRLDPPLLLGKPNGGMAEIISIFPDGQAETDRKLAAIADKFGGSHATVEAYVGLSEIGLTLAKIAHAHAVAKYGYGNFAPFLVGQIRNQDIHNLRLYVGEGRRHAPPTQGLHLLSDRVIVRGKQNLIIVEVALFGAMGLPSFNVVVGRLYKDRP